MPSNLLRFAGRSEVLDAYSNDASFRTCLCCSLGAGDAKHDDLCESILGVVRC